MAMAYAVHLNYHTAHTSSVLSTEEIWKRSNSSHSYLHNSHPWVFPEYVLEPRLQDGNFLPKCMPRSMRDKYLGASPLHVSTVGLVRNLQTGNISSPFNLVFDDYFGTLRTV